MSSITSFNTAQASSTTPSKIIDTNAFTGTIPVGGSIVFPIVSTAQYPHLEVSMVNSRELSVNVEFSSTNEVDGNGDLVTKKGQIREIMIEGTGSEPLSTTTYPPNIFVDIAYPFFRITLRNTDAINDNEVFFTSKLVSTRPSQQHLYDSVLSGGFKTNDDGSYVTRSDGTITTGAVTINDNTNRLRVDAEVTIDDLAPSDDGVAVYGSSDGIDRIIVKTDVDGKVVVEDMNKLEINANKASSEIVFIQEGDPTTSFVSGSGMNATVDLGTGEDRYRNVLFRGKLDASVKTTPKIGMFYSHDGSAFTSDGTYCSFYKIGTNWQFAFQRSNIGCRYVGLICFVECDVTYLSAVMSKN